MTNHSFLCFTALTALLLTGCDQAATNATQSSANHEHHSQESTQAQSSSVASLPLSYIYDCDNGKSLSARYINNDERNSVILTFDNKEYVLWQVVSGSGARYGSEQGFTKDEGIHWHVKGNEAVMLGLPLDDSVTRDDERILFQCEARS